MTLVIAVFSAGTAIEPCTAQVSIPGSWHVAMPPGAEPSTLFGSALNVADVNRDGFDDLIAFAPFADVHSLQDTGRGWVLFGPTFSTHQSFQSSMPAPAEFMGLAKFGPTGNAVGDVDGDGYPDILVGSPDYPIGSLNSGRVHLFFGPDYRRQRIFYSPVPEISGRFGESVQLADVTGDGLADVFVGAPDAEVVLPLGGVVNLAGRVFWWDATALSGMPNEVANPQVEPIAAFGAAIDQGDMADDGQASLFIQSRHQNIIGATHVFQGSGVGYQFSIPAPLPTLGWFGDVIGVGDMTADGVLDVVITSPNSFMIGCSGMGTVLILSGDTFGDVEATLQPPGPCTMAQHYGLNALVMDFDGDGDDDVVATHTGTFPLGDEQVVVSFGPDFDTMQILGSELALLFSGFGREVAAGDFDGDGSEELAVAFSGGAGSGGVLVFDPSSLLSHEQLLSNSAGGSAPFGVDIGSSGANSPYFAVLSASGAFPGAIPAPGVFVPVNIDPLTQLGLSWLNTPMFPGSAGVLDANGKASFSFNVKPGGATPLVGFKLTFACVVTDAHGTPRRGTNAKTVEIVP